MNGPYPTSMLSPTDPGLLWIDAPRFCAGAEVIDGTVAGRIAPIIRYMRGWPMARVRSYCRSKRWELLTCGVDREDRHSLA